MTVLAAVLAQLLQCALMLAAAPVVTGLLASGEALLSGRVGPPLGQPWRELIRLSRKQAVLAESASSWSGVIPPVCFASMASAASLVPSFTLGMAFAPMADLLVIAGLAVAARVALALAALDPGTALPGLAAPRLATLGILAEPTMFVAILALGLLGGTTNLDLLIGLQLQGMLRPISAVALVAFALVALTLAAPGAAALTTEFSGGDLALVEFAEALRLLLWLDLIGGLFLPWGMAGADASPLGWAIGLLAWAARLVVLVMLLTGLHHMLGRLQPQRPQALQVAAALSLLAALLALASTVAT